MSHWAEIDQNNTVIRVVVGNNDDPNGDEGYQWLIDNLGGTWIQTSYNSNFRNKFAGIGDIYDPVKDIFIPYKYFPSWIFNEETNLWDPPIPRPIAENENIYYTWNEENQSWNEHTTI
jgi:hypothetical protein